ncbi:hypothetical protein V2G26_014197 [Clonostachys chloroleuca]
MLRPATFEWPVGGVCTRGVGLMVGGKAASRQACHSVEASPFRQLQAARTCSRAPGRPEQRPLLERWAITELRKLHPAPIPRRPCRWSHSVLSSHLNTPCPSQAPPNRVQRWLAAMSFAILVDASLSYVPILAPICPCPIPPIAKFMPASTTDRGASTRRHPVLVCLCARTL